MSESSYEFLGKRIWQWQAVLAGRPCVAGGGQHLAVLWALPGAEPSVNGAAWLHEHLPIQGSAWSGSSAEGDHHPPCPLLCLLLHKGRSN